MTSRIQQLMIDATKTGVTFDSYSAGGVGTRYRFFAGTEKQSYFSGRGIFTANGIAHAEIFLAGYVIGRESCIL